MINKKRILIMAGGTGGHVFPALAIAALLKQKGHEVIWLGTHQGIEARLVPDAGIPLHFITINGVRGKGLLQKLLSPYKIVNATYQALKIIRSLKPQAVIGLGGFASGPGGIATFMLTIPLLIHEQNAIAGMTNWLLAHIAKKVMEAFPHTFSARFKPILTGNPVRENILNIPPPEKRFLNRTGSLRILILGGSGGALALNQLIPETFKLLQDLHKTCIFELQQDKNQASAGVYTSYEIWHQTGLIHLKATQDRYAKFDVKAKVEAFITEMAEAYTWADLIICRAGALTIAELAATGVASILIPYPFAVDDHQTKNALYLVNQGAASLLPQSQLNPHVLAEIIKPLTREKLLEKAKIAYSLRLPHATELVVKECEHYL